MGDDVDDSWEDYFEEKILDRGYDYYICNQVENIRQTDDKIYATVNGSVDYQVVIELDEEENLWDMKCSCPYAEDYFYCKHMASVCYYIENNNIVKVSSNNKDNDLFSNTLDKKFFANYIDSQIDSFEYNDLKNFLNDLIVEDITVFRQFMSYKETFCEEDKEIYEQILNSILSKQINFKDDEFIEELSDFLCYDLMSWYHKESYDFVIHLVESILIKLGMTTYISETDDFNEVFNKIDEILSDILKINKDVYKNQISDMLNNILVKYSDTIFINNFMSLFKKYGGTKNNDTMIVLLKKQLEELDDFYKLDKIKEIIKVMNKSKYSNMQIIDFLEEHLDVEGCEEILSSYYIKNDQKDKAITLLRTFCSDKAYDTRSVKVLEQLKKIYLNDNDYGYIECIEDEIFIHHIYSKENIDLLKDYYKSGWNTKRNEIIRHYQNNIRDYNLYKFLLNEKKYEEFKSNILSNTEFHELKKYHELLAERFPEELYDTYTGMVEQLLIESKPKNYRQSAEILKQTKKIPGKEDAINNYIEHLKEEYPRRTRMIKEFENI